jgi:hypothetical protein
MQGATLKALTWATVVTAIASALLLAAAGADVFGAPVNNALVGDARAPSFVPPVLAEAFGGATSEIGAATRRDVPRNGRICLHTRPPARRSATTSRS